MSSNKIENKPKYCLHQIQRLYVSEKKLENKTSENSETVLGDFWKYKNGAKSAENCEIEPGLAACLVEAIGARSSAFSGLSGRGPCECAARERFTFSYEISASDTSVPFEVKSIKQKSTY